MHKDKTVLVFNPKSGRKRAKQISQKYLRMFSGPSVLELVYGESAAHTQEILSNSISDAKYCIAVGGDGLMNLVLQEVVQKDICLFVHPAGTGNDFARTSFQKMSDLAKIVEAIGSNSYRHIDVIKVDLLDSSRYFGQVLSSGFDSYVNARANRIKYLPGSLKYILALLLELPSFKPISYRFEIDGEVREIQAMMMVLANGATYGGGMKIVPHADNSDGLINLMVLHPVSKFELLKVFPKVFTGKHIEHSEIELLTCKEIQIQSSAPIYADGEYFGQGLFKATVMPAALKILEI